MSYSQVLELAEGLGVTGPLVGARWFADRAAALNAELSQRRAEVERDYAELVTDLTAGTVGVVEVQARASAVALWAHDAPAARAYVAAVAACHHRAEAEMASSAGALFTALVGVIDGVVAKSARLVRGLPDGVVNELSAARAGKTGTWTELTELLQRWRTAHGLAAELRIAGWLPQYDVSGDPTWNYIRYQDPLRLPRDYWVKPGELQLGTAAECGAGPGLFPAADAAQRWRANLDRARARERAELTRLQAPMNQMNVIR